MTSPPIPSVESTSPLKMHLDKRPSITSLTPVRPASEIGSPTSSSQHLPLDRRAFSVPGMQALPPQSVMTEDRKPRQIGNVLPPFGRKSSIVTTSLNSPAFPVDPYPLTRSLAPGMGSANANCAKIPHFSDSVFCSTSERSDEEPEKPPVKLLSPIPPPARASNSTSIVHASPLPDDRRFPILRSQLHSAQSNAHLRNREASHLPVAATVASSASLRSREDIILWAKAVGMRLGKSSDDEEDQTRDRSRTGREPLRHLPPPSTELLDEHEEHKATGSGTYDAEGQSRLCAGRTGCEFYRPDRYASHERDEHCDFAQANPSAPPPPGLGLQSVRAPAEISRVAVVGTTLPGEDRHDAPAAQSFGGATPTLSTKSFTEAVDHLTGDDHDPVDIVLDDQSAESIGFAGRPMPLKPRRPSYSSTIRPPVPERRKHNSLPLHPNATTASSIWNLSASLHSFASFSIGSVIAPQSFFAAVDALDPALESSIPSLVHTPLQSAAPMPALRADSLTQETAPAAQDLIRSPSMDIIPRHNANGDEEGPLEVALVLAIPRLCLPQQELIGGYPNGAVEPARKDVVL
ncbi:hypothetical protein EHS25_004864 [Saitozyma podzolica]|uniref:Uncharacterized protein n=1 Tax=Saitozyma podzolica TaxID=1890683 RepID=A0A427Y2W7_9TREE|nr:hypothetical protein EHS25_004864 [Saitozyma podzolica]